MKRLPAALAFLFIAGAVGAQQPRIETKTIELKHLKPSEAVKLLRPYIMNAGGGVYDVSESMPIITIRDLAENIDRMEKVLAKYDHTPATVRLVFQLIEADTGPRLINASNTKEQVPIELDSTLRSVLRFPTYRLKAQGIATTGEMAYVSQQMGDAGEGLHYALGANVGPIKIQDQDGSSPRGTVELHVGLTREGPQQMSQGNNVSGRPDKISESMISTGVSVPLGTMVVLGTAATRINGVALILTVKPELVRAK